MSKKKVLVLIDRDGTLIYDDKYYLGRQKNWKSKIEFLPGVVLGIKLLNKIPNVILYVITNQPGVAVKNFKLLTEKRANFVTEEIVKMLKSRGAEIEDYILCPHADAKYLKKYPERKFDKKYVGECSCIKPRTGMITKALKKEKLKKNEVKIYVIGDRESDARAGINAGGYGILVPFKNLPEEKKKFKKIKTKKKFLAKNFAEAARFILKKEK